MEHRSSDSLVTPTEGVIVGVNAHQEWLLPWWWMNLRLHCTHEVTFINFGDMSKEAVAWCERKGKVILVEVNEDIIASKELVAPDHVKLWESIHPEMWKIRLGWFKKPFAMQKSPYTRTIWLDVDCQVRGSIDSLFTQCLNEAGIAIAPEAEESQALNLYRKIILPGEIVLNTGVVAFTNDSKIIKEWANQVSTQSHLHFGDQQLLVRILFTQNLKFTILSRTFNWTAESGMNQKATILHWSGNFKNNLKQHVEYLKEYFFINLDF